MEMELNESVKGLSGIGEKIFQTLQKIEISTLKDLVYHLPRAYKDFSHIKKIGEARFGETAFFEGKIVSQPTVKRPKRNLEITSFQIADGTGIAAVDIFNQFYIKNNLATEIRFIFMDGWSIDLAKCVLQCRSCISKSRKRLFSLFIL